MKISDVSIRRAIANFYRHSAGPGHMSRELLEDRFERVKKLLDSLDGKGYSDLDILRIALETMESEVIKLSH